MVGAAAVVAEAVVGVVDNRTNESSEAMNIRPSFTSSLTIWLFASVTVAFALVLGVSHAGSPETAAKTDSNNQKEFTSAREAADTLLRAAEVFDIAVLQEILGSDATDLIKSADPVADKKRATDFAAKSKEKISLDVDPKNSKRTILSVGNDTFPLAIPIVRRKGKWIFDTKAGRQEILNRRIGANELDAIAICRENAFKTLRDVERHLFFWNPLARNTAAVVTAMASIDHHDRGRAAALRTTICLGRGGTAADWDRNQQTGNK